MELPDILQPETMTPVRPGGEDGKQSIVRSYLLMRTAVGVLGTALPVLLLLGEAVLLEDAFSARGSLSAYYHSGMRDVFVGILVAVAFFLISYKLFERNLDNTLSSVAGVAALGVALFPTGIPSGIEASLTPLQDRLGERGVEVAHYIFAATFMVCLGIICYFFAIREGRRSQHRTGYSAKRSPQFWKRFHLSMTGAIALAVAFIVLTELTGVFEKHSLLIGETVVAFAFGLSWLMKGLELDPLLGRTP